MNALNFYIAADGCDDWSGQLPQPSHDKMDGPFATLNRARDAVRQIRHNDSRDKPVSIFIRKGIYRLSEPFTLLAQDSGTVDAPITYCAYQNEKPILSGGCELTNWTTTAEGWWQTRLPKRIEPFDQLFVNNERRERARSEVFEIADVIDPSQSIDEELGENTKKRNDNHLGFRFQPGQITRDEAIEDIEVVVIHNFATTRMKIADLDEAEGVVRFTGCEYIWSYAPPKRFYLENTRAGLISPGAWHHDRQAKTITYHPLPGETVDNIQVVVPRIEQIIRLEGDSTKNEFVEHLTFRGLSMRHSGWRCPDDGFRDPQAATVIPAAISAQGTRHCTLEGNEITQTGNYAIELGRGCRDNRIIANHLHDLGAGGIKIGETIHRESDDDETRATVIADNTIHNAGRVFPEGIGIWIGQSSGNKIAHNHIHDLPYTGISMGWNWNYTRNRTRDNIITHNHIHHVMQGELDDGGAIYNLGVSPGTVIRNNLIHHVFGRTYAYGIYLDEGSMGVLVENNIIHHFSGAGIRLQIATGGNIILNNIIALGTQAQFGVDTDRTNTYLCNIIYWKQGKLFIRDDWDNFETIFDQNLYYHAGGEAIDFGGYNFEQWQQQRARRIRYIKPEPIDGRSLVADPLFGDPDAGNFELSPKSPALKLGFKPIDATTIGPRQS